MEVKGARSQELGPGDVLVSVDGKPNSGSTPFGEGDGPELAKVPPEDDVADVDQGPEPERREMKTVMSVTVIRAIKLRSTVSMKGETNKELNSKKDGCGRAKGMSSVLIELALPVPFLCEVAVN